MVPLTLWQPIPKNKSNDYKPNRAVIVCNPEKYRGFKQTSVHSGSWIPSYKSKNCKPNNCKVNNWCTDWNCDVALIWDHFVSCWSLIMDYQLYRQNTAKYRKGLPNYIPAGCFEIFASVNILCCFYIVVPQDGLFMMKHIFETHDLGSPLILGNHYSYLS